MKKTTRRRFIKTLAAGGAVAAVQGASAATTTTTTAATATASNKLVPEEIAAALRVLGHDFSEVEQKMMAEGLESRRELFRSLRKRTIDPRFEPPIRFDPRVPGVTYPSGESSFRLSDAPTRDYDGNVNSLVFASAAELSRLIGAKKVTSLELTRMCLHRLDTIGRRLNAVVNLTSELALAQAKRCDEETAQGKSRGPLHGIPYGAKDLLATKDIPTTLGVKPFENLTTDYDATVIERLEAAGAVLCAKLSLGELAMGDVWFGGKTRSPWNEKDGSSGSSAGPCACVAAGCVVFAIGSETMGSIISPCLVNKTTGLRPTYGRVSRYGAFPLAMTMDKLGPITRGVEDAAMVLSAIHGADGRDLSAAANVPFVWDPRSDVKQLRVGYDVAAFEGLTKDKNNAKRKALEKALEKIREIAGGELTPVHLPPAQQFSGVASMTIAAESAFSFTELVASRDVRKLVQQHEGAWPNTFRKGAMIPAADYLRGMQVRNQLMHAMHEAMRDVDLYVTIPYAGPTIAFTNITGHPSLVTRCSDGENIFLIEFLGQLYREDATLRLAFAHEQATNFNRTWPSI